MKPLTVKVTIEVPIDREAWILNYGNEPTANVVDYVKEASDELVKEHWRKLGVLAESESESA